MNGLISRTAVSFAFVAITLGLAACGDSSASSTVLATSTTISTTTLVPVTTVVDTTTTIVATTQVPVEETSTTTTAPQGGQGAELTDSARLSTIGLGPVFTGDLLAVVAEKLGVELVLDATIPGTDQCRVYTAPGAPPGVTFMVAFGRVARVDIDSPSVITTRSGAGIGSTKEEIIGLFGDKIQVRANAATGGEDLVFVPIDEKDKNLRIVFEADPAGVVQHLRTGQLPEVDYAGC
jgi:hypothetical protein